MFIIRPSFLGLKSSSKEKPLDYLPVVASYMDGPSVRQRVIPTLGRLEVDLQARLEKKGVATSWPDLMRDLGQLQAIRMALDGNNYQTRTDFEGNAYQAFQATGVRPPSRVGKM